MVQNVETTAPDAAAETPPEPAPPITSRFLFVDVAAQRAKQLRRGALPRLERTGPWGGVHKLERIAMEEVRQGAIQYILPPTPEAASRGETA